MNDLLALIERHRSNGLLIDTNLLLLYTVGKTNKKRIPLFKRTESIRSRILNCWCVWRVNSEP